MTWGEFHLPDTYAIFMPAGLDFLMRSMDEKRNTPEMHVAERMKTPIHPGSGILRRAIRENIVSFPAQIPKSLKRAPAEIQWRMVVLFFVRGWSAAKIAERFQVPKHRVWTLLNEWSVRAIALGHIQVIDPEAFEACSHGEVECRIDDDAEEKRLAEVRPLVKSVPRAFSDVAPRAALFASDVSPASGGPLDSRSKSIDLIAALDMAVARCEEWGGEFWMRTGMHLRDLRAAALAALDVGHSSERRDGFFTASQGRKGGLGVRDEERVSHAVA